MRAKDGQRTTKKQILANRRNSRQGGPKTARGKAASRLNARKHGVRSRVLTDEDREELDHIRERFTDAIRPQGAEEEALVEELCVIHLRLLLSARAEAELLGGSAASSTAGDGGLPAAGEGFELAAFERMAKTFGRYDRTLTNRLIEVLREIARHQGVRRRPGETP